MDKDRVAGSAKKIKAEGKANKIEGKVQNAVGGLKDILKSTASTRLRATSQRKTLLASAAMIGADLCGLTGAQGGISECKPHFANKTCQAEPLAKAQRR
jgi:hypothetical protein